MFHGQQIRSVLLNPHLVVGFLLLVDVVDYRGLVFLHADVDYAVAVVDKDVARMLPGCGHDVAWMWPGCCQGVARMWL